MTAAAPRGPHPDAPEADRPPAPPEADRPGLFRGLLGLVASALGREPDLHSGDDGHALDEEEELDAF
ncbi:hypothetical protein [Actinoallomurus liliacearum]|uniref:hypothetical protein n=1 Tax=Actinoallomurus liliacearum TaxID=1080073 RepID=UPI0031EBA5F5